MPWRPRAESVRVVCGAVEALAAAPSGRAEWNPRPTEGLPGVMFGLRAEPAPSGLDGRKARTGNPAPPPTPQRAPCGEGAYLLQAENCHSTRSARRFLGGPQCTDFSGA